MKLIESLLKLLNSLFGGRKKPPKEISPEPEDGSEEIAEPEPPDEPGEEFDDPSYDVENITDDDDTERDPLPEPDADTIEHVEREMSPADLWKDRQEKLGKLGYDPGPVDGKPGPETARAIRDFQKAHGLVADGVWGPKTEGAVARALKDKDGSSTPYTPPPPVIGKPRYEEMIGDVELDDDFWGCFVDLTSKSNVKDNKGRRRRKGRRMFSKLVRLCWHQTAFTWKPYKLLKSLKKWSSHHKINAHACFDTDGTILLIHNFYYYLWTANAYNRDCLSFEVMGNYEGELGTGNWYKPDKFGRARPFRIQIIRSRQMIKWLLDPEQGPADEDLPKPLLEWRAGCREHGNPLKWNNCHRQSSGGRVLDCGSELWYHVGRWGIETCKQLTEGPTAGKGMDLPAVWYEKPVIEPLPPQTVFASKVDVSSKNR